jgi:hypothetical protein
VRRHVSAEVLARYQEGDLRARRAARVAAHLSACSRCARTGSELTAVPGLLAGIGRPAMPADVAERLTLAIAAESAARAAGDAAPAPEAVPGSAAGAATGVPASPADPVATAGAAGSAGSAGGAGAAGAAGPAQDRVGGADGGPPDNVPGHPDRTGRKDRNRVAGRRLQWPGLSSPVLLRGAAAVAVVIVLAGAGFLLARVTIGPATGGSGSSSGNSGAAGAPSARQPAEHHPVSAPDAAQLHYRLHGGVVTTTALASMMNFTRAGLAGQVQRAVARHVSLPFGTATPVSVNGRISGGPLLGGIKIGTLNGCLSRVSEGRRVLLTEVARFLGKPATIIVLKSFTAHVLDVAIVGPACSAGRADYIVRTTVPAG